MRRFLSVILMVSGFWASAALAGDRPVVVELFTSQGCSKCPPADRFLTELSQREDVITLALHVDYWDYIGWKDVFAQPKFTKRQKAYAQAMGEKMIYTPQMVINGRDEAIGSYRNEVRALISEHAETDTGVDLTAAIVDGSVSIRAEVTQGRAKAMDVQLVQYSPKQEVSILRGENAGQTYTYTSIVREWTTVGQWTGKQALDMTVPVNSDLPVVVLLQERGNGPILAAVKLD